MRVRLFELRLLALLLFVLWSGAFALMVVGYHPGGPFDHAVAGAALLPCVVAALAVLWPPLARGERASVAVGWLGVGAALLLVPSVAGLAGPLMGTSGETLLPAPEVAYAAILALFATCLFAGLGLAREVLGETALRRRRLFLGTAVALALTALVSTAFGAAAVANDVALRSRALPPSAWGPTDPTAMPPTCGGPLTVGPAALISETASATAGASTIGSARLDGARNGSDQRWAATLDLGGKKTGLDYVQVGRRSWTRPGRGAWTETTPGSDATASVPASAGTSSAAGPAAGLDEAILLAALAPGQRVAADDAGIELVGGARARHCRTTITGAIAVASFEPLSWLAGGSLPVGEVLGPWRGQLDWWVFGDGQLGLATVHLTGRSPAAWGSVSPLGTLDARLQATERDQPQVVLPPG